jgi:hypothetical protein
MPCVTYLRYATLVRLNACGVEASFSEKPPASVWSLSGRYSLSAKTLEVVIHTGDVGVVVARAPPSINACEPRLPLLSWRDATKLNLSQHTIRIMAASGPL